jgi:hypothetical protein
LGIGNDVIGMTSSKEKAIKFLEEIQKQFLINRFGVSYLEKVEEMQGELNNPDYFDHFIKKVIGYKQDTEKFKEFYNEINLSERFLATKYEIIPLCAMLEQHFVRILGAAEKCNLSRENIQHTYIGTVLSGNYNGFACRIPETCENLILLDGELFFLVSILSKIITLSLPEFEHSNNTMQFSTDKDKILKHISENAEIRYRFKLLVYDYFYMKRSITYLKPDLRFVNFRVNLINSLELFIVGHEYGHIISGHLENSTTEMLKVNNIDIEGIKLNWENEYEADAIGIKLMLEATKLIGQLPFCYVGADLFFTFLDVHERALALFSTGEECKSIGSDSHPPTAMRREKIKKCIKSNIHEKDIFIYDVFSKFIDNIIEILWNDMKEKWALTH